MSARVRLERAPSPPRQSYEVAKELARALELSLTDARSLLARAPLTLPRGLEEAEATKLTQRLSSLGAVAHVVHPLAALGTSCSEHPQLDGVEGCRECDAPLCVACAARVTPSRVPLCSKCAQGARRKQRHYRARLAVWTLLLAAVCIYGLRRWWSGRADWSAPTRVAFILMTPAGDEVDALAVDAFRDRVPALEAKLREQSSRYLPESAVPFELTMLGPVERDVSLPRLEGDSLFALGRFNYELWRFARHVDALGGLDTSGFDVRIYVSAVPPASAARQSVEGASQDGGSLGLVEVELAPDSVDLGLFVAAHELFHTRGASDKYGPDGLALRPIGYADPDGVPLYPQRGVEVMARGRPLSPTLEAPPDDLDALTVGPQTAREIGWQSEEP